MGQLCNWWCTNLGAPFATGFLLPLPAGQPLMAAYLSSLTCQIDSLAQVLTQIHAIKVVNWSLFCVGVISNGHIFRRSLRKVKIRILIDSKTMKELKIYKLYKNPIFSNLKWVGVGGCHIKENKRIIKIIFFLFIIKILPLFYIKGWFTVQSILSRRRLAHGPILRPLYSNS